MPVTIIALQALHVLFAIYWFGGLLWTELALWPQMRKAGILAEVQGNLRSPQARRIQAISVFGTIITGYLRGVAGGVFDHLYTLHSLYFVLAALVGFSMAVWWACFPPRTMKNCWRAYYSGFWVVFALMIGMRFTA